METFDIIYGKYLNSLKEEILSYKNEENIWKLHGDMKNPPANLALHLCGNLKNYICAIIGNTGYKRMRDMEFSKKNVPRDEIIAEINSTIEAVTPVLRNLTPEDLNKEYPAGDFGEGQSIGWVITVLGFHFGYHLGQINYHRRMFEY